MPHPDSLLPGSREQSGHDDSSLDNFTTDVAVANDVDDAITESEPDAEEEIDQLDSDSDVPPEQQQPPDAPAPSAPKKPSQSRNGERRAGQSLLPAVRVENILQAEGLTGNVNLSKEAIFLLSVATEEFIRNFSKLAHGRSQYYNRNMVRYDDLASVVNYRSDHRFLRDTIPAPVTLQVAFAAKTKREKDLLRDDPAMQFQDGRSQLNRPPSPGPVNGQGIVVVESHPGSHPASYSGMKPKICPPKSTARRPQSSKSAAPTPPLGASSSTITAAHSFTEPTETWEEWREKSRRLYGTSESSRQKHSQSINNLPNGEPSPHPPPTAHNSSEPSLTSTPVDQYTMSGPGSMTLHANHSEDASVSYDRPMKILTGPGSAYLQGPGTFTHNLPDVRWAKPPSKKSSKAKALQSSEISDAPIPPDGRGKVEVASPSSSSAGPPGRTIYAMDSDIQANREQ